MNDETRRYLAELEGRVAALSGIVALLLRVLRERGTMDADLEHRLFLAASEAVASLPAEAEPGADRLIAALQSSTRVLSPSL